MNDLATLTLASSLAMSVFAVWQVFGMRSQISQSKMQTFFWVVSQVEATRGDRDIVRAYVRDRQKSQRNMHKEEELAADKVCRAFDIVAMLDRTKLIDSDLVDQFYGVAFADLYDTALRDHVTKLRRDDNRGPTHYWDLVQFYDRVKNIRNVHPALTGKTHWPKRPRSAGTPHKA